MKSEEISLINTIILHMWCALPYIFYFGYITIHVNNQSLDPWLSQTDSNWKPVCVCYTHGTSIVRNTARANICNAVIQRPPRQVWMTEQAVRLTLKLKLKYKKCRIATDFHMVWWLIFDVTFCLHLHVTSSDMIDGDLPNVCALHLSSCTQYQPQASSHHL